MSTSVARLYRRSSLPVRLQVAALAGYAVVFGALLAYGRPGIGIGQGFYVPIVLAASAGGPAAGAAAGVLATFLYEIALFPHDGVTPRAGMHLLWYVAAGLLVGYFANRGRAMLAEALNALEDLLRLTRRDLDTGVRSADGLHGVLADQIVTGSPFGLLVGKLEHCEDDADVSLRLIIGAIAESLDDCVEIARVGAAHLAVIVSTSSPEEARAAASALEQLLERRATFGWATYPVEGRDALALFQAASERLYERRVVRGEWEPTAETAGLLDAR
ncbi:MAG TPA: hypothetical protein VGN27_06465 [Gaiellaceae bacterium]|jgi:hypothetical protein|nr:hypothetical protein [Gaiellaceae bacterium]